MKELTDNPNIIVFIDELHTLVGAGSAEGSLDAANILKPALSPRRDPLHRRDDARRVPQLHREGSVARAPVPGDQGRSARRARDDRDPARRQGSLRELPPRRIHARGDRSGRLPVEPLHHGPVPAGQGDRPAWTRPARAPSCARPATARSSARSTRASASPSSRWRARSSQKDFEKAQFYREQEVTARENLQFVREKFDVKSSARERSSSASRKSTRSCPSGPACRWRRSTRTKGDKLLRMEQRSPPPRHQPGEGDFGDLPRDPPLARRAQEPESAGRELRVPRPDRRRQDRAGRARSPTSCSAATTR